MKPTCRGEIFMYACKINVTAGLVCLCSKAKSWYFRKETGKRSSQSLSANNYKKVLYLNNACCIMPGGDSQINMTGWSSKLLKNTPKSYQYGCGTCKIYPLKVQQKKSERLPKLNLWITSSLVLTFVSVSQLFRLEYDLCEQKSQKP